MVIKNKFTNNCYLITLSQIHQLQQQKQFLCIMFNTRHMFRQYRQMFINIDRCPVSTGTYNMNTDICPIIVYYLTMLEANIWRTRKIFIFIFVGLKQDSKHILKMNYQKRSNDHRSVQWIIRKDPTTTDPFTYVNELSEKIQRPQIRSRGVISLYRSGYCGSTLHWRKRR